jgi:hypothetical protein
VEEALKAGGIIFLFAGAPTFEEGSTTDEPSKIGTLCRVSRKLMPYSNGPDLVEEGFVAEGLDRACAVRFIKNEGFLSAEVFYDPSPDLAPDEEQLKMLDQEVRRLLGELHALLPERDGPWWRSFHSQYPSVSSEVERLFNVQDITSPSRLADRSAFLLYLLGLISPGQQRAILETFGPERRLQVLSRILNGKLEPETRQIEALLQKRTKRRFGIKTITGRRPGSRNREKPTDVSNRAREDRVMEIIRAMLRLLEKPMSEISKSSVAGEMKGGRGRSRTTLDTWLRDITRRKGEDTFDLMRLAAENLHRCGFTAGSVSESGVIAAIKKIKNSRVSKKN